MYCDKTGICQNGKVFVRSGAGIVADSVPEMNLKNALIKLRL